MPLYHVTPARLLPRILDRGLSPRTGPRASALGETEPAIYLFESLADVEDALTGWLGEWFSDEGLRQGELVVLEVDLPEDISTRKDVGYERVVLEGISPQCIGRILEEDLQTERVAPPVTMEAEVALASGL